MVGVTFEVSPTYFRDLQIDMEGSVLLLSLLVYQFEETIFSHEVTVFVFISP